MPFTLEDEYEQNVRECQRMAENSKSEIDRASWLRLGQEWLRMLRKLRGDETLQVDQSRWRVSRDDDSSTSH